MTHTPRPAPRQAHWWLSNIAPGRLAQAFRQRAKWAGINWEAGYATGGGAFKDDGRTIVDALENAEAISSAHESHPDTHMIMLDVDSAQ
ncbi:MAG: hypothetical protein HZY75_15725 [Nocardioidaceae bacterium]|nr:MAG: hypothetical protein HZY75_15725 [Nocardioidaceae bacterium]